MVFAHDTELFLSSTAALLNTRSSGVDQLDTVTGLRTYLAAAGWGGTVLGSAEELASVRVLREHLRDFWQITDREEAARYVNDLLAETDARPYLTKHDAFDWHLHLTRDDAPLARRIGAEAAMGFLDLVREDELDRLRHCAAADCDDVLVDLSKNRSKRYCDSGNCGNRTNVAAYRARKRGS
ncbi:MAG TPA: CGNR zinc finger domain-containing protein [Microlunatus sp.]|nr:CGNR zinc finger domain-containing protein [Microlunatus sp.]